MNVILAAVNAKYIHSNLAVYDLKAYAKKYGEQASIAEYTINQTVDEILRDLFCRKPDVLCFSCYIWNIEYIKELVEEIKKILPRVDIWLGGPEVSYDSRKVLEELPQVLGVMKGEGEETFLEVLRCYRSGKMGELRGVLGITFRDREKIVENDWRKAMELSKVPFVYESLADFEHKIIYYESSRGCPFSCSYCLSSVDKCLRFRDLEVVKRELSFFLDHKVEQVKFVDRTFNCKHDHAKEIWRYLIEHDNGITNFHFEISADLLDDEEIALIKSMRPGLIQLEIGVQSTNERTIREIKRTMKFEKVAEVVKQINEGGNIHQHLDLIAGLPYEDLESFRRSFNDVYALRPEQLQLGFLKVLKGSYMEEQKETYGLLYKAKPPYEVLATKWISYGEIVRLKEVEEMVEVYYNSRQFVNTLEELEKEFADAFSMFEAIADFYEQRGYVGMSHARTARFEILFALAGQISPQKKERYRELLTYDFYLRENAKNRPVFAGEETVEKEWLREFYKRETREHRYLKGYEKYDVRQLRKMTHVEKFEYLKDGPVYVLFDYQNRSPLDHQAAHFDVEFHEELYKD